MSITATSLKYLSIFALGTTVLKHNQQVLLGEAGPTAQQRNIT